MKIAEEFQGVIRNRLTNPILGTFFLVWSVTNWRFILYLLFGDDNVQTRIKQLEALINVDQMFINPMLFTLVYLILLPQATYLINYYTNQVNQRTKRMEARFEHEIKKKMNELNILEDDAKNDFFQRIRGETVQQSIDEIEPYIERKLQESEKKMLVDTESYLASYLRKVEHKMENKFKHNLSDQLIAMNNKISEFKKNGDSLIDDVEGLKQNIRWLNQRIVKDDGQNNI